MATNIENKGFFSRVLAPKLSCILNSLKASTRNVCTKPIVCAALIGGMVFNPFGNLSRAAADQTGGLLYVTIKGTGTYELKNAAPSGESVPSQYQFGQPQFVLGCDFTITFTLDPAKFNQYAKAMQTPSGTIMTATGLMADDVAGAPWITLSSVVVNGQDVSSIFFNAITPPAGYTKDPQVASAYEMIEGLTYRTSATERGFQEIDTLEVVYKDPYNDGKPSIAQYGLDYSPGAWYERKLNFASSYLGYVNGSLQKVSGSGANTINLESKFKINIKEGARKHEFSSDVSLVGNIASCTVSTSPPRGTSATSFDTTTYVNYVDKHVLPKSTGNCATHIREGLQAGGAKVPVINSRYPNALGYGPVLTTNGFTPIDFDPSADLPQLGDTAVFQPFPGGNPAGHVEVWDGHQWVSDWPQRRFWPSQDYEDNPNYQVYRAPSN